MKIFILGMIAQAFATAFLANFNLITLCWQQQAIAMVLLTIVYVFVPEN